MSRSNKREATVTFKKDLRKIAKWQIARAFREGDGTISFSPTPQGPAQFKAALDAIIVIAFRPVGVKDHEWRRAMRLEFELFCEQETMEFARGGNAVRMNRRQMRNLAARSDNHEQARGKPKLRQHAKRDYVNRITRPTRLAY